MPYGSLWWSQGVSMLVGLGKKETTLREKRVP